MTVRGSCPGISDPMMTGDGLLARLACDAPIPIPEFIALCEASGAYGNGIIEVTQRGSLQFRGLTETSAPEFARKVSSLGVAACPARVLGPPLESEDDLLKRVRSRLAQADFASLGPKVSVLIDGGGRLHLDQLRADIRLRAVGGRFHLSLGGDAEAAVALGWVRSQDAEVAIERLAALIAGRGPSARARDFLSAADVATVHSALEPLVTAGERPEPRPSAEPIGIHVLETTAVAVGFALPFGHSTGSALQRFARAAALRGAHSIRPAPGRALLAVELSRTNAEHLVVVAEQEDFIVRPDDPRRYVVACTGIPGCASASVPTRELAPTLARVAGELLDGSVTIHLSGCAKGCAHPGRAALTFIGPDRVVVEGSADDTPHGTCSPAQLVAGIRRLSRERAWHDGTSADFLAQMGGPGVVELIRGEPRVV
jgi:precorrin-3B synthase